MVMIKMKYLLLSLMILNLSACVSPSTEKLVAHADNLKSHENFGVCSDYGCKQYQMTGLTKEEWQGIKDIFLRPVTSPVMERQLIAKAIARIEQFIGPKTGTDDDKARAIPINFKTDGQMDCIDEAFNTTSYLYLMRQDGLIKLHSLGAHLRRNFADLSYPHSTATIHEIGLDKKIAGDGHYVVDSWFHKNGALAETIPASLWIGPWYPSVRQERYNFSAS